MTMHAATSVEVVVPDLLSRKERELLLHGSTGVEVPMLNPRWLTLLGGEEGPCKLGDKEGRRI